jgi:predicted DNA-binding transcriptional regulator YafY
MYDNNNYGRGQTQRKQMHYSPNLLSTINNAIDNHKVSEIEYDSREKGISVRNIEPLAIVYKDRKRHLVAFCRLRNDFRSFRLDRLNTIKLFNETFTVRPDFLIENFQDSQANVGNYAEVYEDDEE